MLGSYGPLPGQSGKTRFVVLNTRTLSVRRSIVLDGSWSFDAVSPTAGTLYFTEHLRVEETSRSIAFTYDAAVVCAAPSSTASKARRRWAANPS